MSNYMCLIKLPHKKCGSFLLGFFKGEVADRMQFQIIRNDQGADILLTLNEFCPFIISQKKCAGAERISLQ